MNRPRLLVIGGFLGAGKTTALLRLAKMYHDEGKVVGLITNDQAAHLVDTGVVRFHGFRVEEVAGACFCCKFDELAQAADRLRAEAGPDVLIAEPVGSCTDLAATVIAPLKALHGDRFSVAPYSVLLDPERARQIILEKGFGGFSSKVAYIFQKQLEEADVIGLNKVDLLGPSARKRILDALEAEFPRATVIATSGATGEGFGAWQELLEGEGSASARVVDVDYDRYAEGEAELGWLNLVLDVHAPSPFDPDLLVKGIVERMSELIAERGAEAAHVKVLFESGARSAMANYVGGSAPARLSLSGSVPSAEGKLTVNARVHMDPDALRSVAWNAALEALRDRGARETLEASSHFRPGRPVPTHRYAAARAEPGQP